MRVSQRAFDVTLFYRIVRQIGSRPQSARRWIAINAELRVRARHTEKSIAVVISRLRERIEMIHADWRPVAMNLDRDRSLRGVEGRLKNVRRFLLHLRLGRLGLL